MTILGVYPLRLHVTWVKIVPRSSDEKKIFIDTFPKLTFKDGYSIVLIRIKNVNEYQFFVAGNLLLNHTSTSSAYIFLLKSILVLDRFPIYWTYKTTPRIHVG